jgi:hypothetical protein
MISLTRHTLSSGFILASAVGLAIGDQVVASKQGC